MDFSWRGEPEHGNEAQTLGFEIRKVIPALNLSIDSYKLCERLKTCNDLAHETSFNFIK